MMLSELMNITNRDPKKLFIVDAFGALLSSFLLGVILVKFEHIFGIPKPTLYFLALLPCLFAAYDFCCYLAKDVAVGKYLKGIAFMNIGYCILSIGMALYHIQKLTWLGWSYIIVEVIIVLSIAIFELKVAKTVE